MFPALQWRNHKRHSDGGCLFHEIAPAAEGEDCSDEIVAFLRTDNDAFLRRFHQCNSVECDDGTAGREHNCTCVICNDPRAPMTVSWVNRSIKQTMPDLTCAEMNCGFLRIGCAVRTGKEDDTDENCLPLLPEDQFEGKFEVLCARNAELEEDNDRLRAKCRALMELVLSLGGSMTDISKASKAACNEFKSKFKRRGRPGGENGHRKAART